MDHLLVHSVGIRMTEDRDKWRKYVHGVANPRIEKAKEQNRTVLVFMHLPRQSKP